MEQEIPSLQRLNQIYKTFIKRQSFDDADEIEIMLPYFWIAVLTFRNTSGGYVTRTFNPLTSRGGL